MTDREKTIEALALYFMDAIGHDDEMAKESARDHALHLYGCLCRGEVPGVGVEGGWVKCGERMPTAYQEVLVAPKHSAKVYAGIYCPSVESFPFRMVWTNYRDVEVTHWRASPKGPLL
jgi:hypothetical protein